MASPRNGLQKQKLSLFKGYQNCPQGLEKQGKKRIREKKEGIVVVRGGGGEREGGGGRGRKRKRQRKKRNSQNYTETMLQK